MRNMWTLRTVCPPQRLFTLRKQLSAAGVCGRADCVRRQYVGDDPNKCFNALAQLLLMTNQPSDFPFREAMVR